MQMKLFVPFVLAALVLSCSKHVDYLYYQPSVQDHSITQKVREVTGTNKLDVFWVIGGMTEQARNFNQGVGTFMSTFVTKPYDWRMAVVSSNTVEPPYIGMPTPFDRTDVNATTDFETAVAGALNGEDDEEIFDPIQSYLNTYSSFIRPEADLVLILTNDAPDSSRRMRSAAAMIQYLKSLKGGDQSKVIVYGIFGATDLNCQRSQIDDYWNYKGSEFEALINATGGQVYSLCDASFGTQLGKLGENLYSKLDNPKIQLSAKVDPTTIKVLFHGQPLPGGPQNTGGYWYYSVRDHNVVFYNLDFAKNDTEEVTVTYSDATDT